LECRGLDSKASPTPSAVRVVRHAAPARTPHLHRASPRRPRAAAPQPQGRRRSPGRGHPRTRGTGGAPLNRRSTSSAVLKTCAETRTEVQRVQIRQPTQGGEGMNLTACQVDGGWPCWPLECHGLDDRPWRLATSPGVPTMTRWCSSAAGRAALPATASHENPSTSITASTNGAGASWGRLCPTPPVMVRWTYLPENFMA
jgi:hypothetical protein